MSSQYISPARATPNQATPSRPISQDSYFADSAIGVDSSAASTPLFKSLQPLDDLPETSSGLFERLTQLAAQAYDAEQDGKLHEDVVENVHKRLEDVEVVLSGEVVKDERTPTRESFEKEGISEIPQQILDELSTTVAAMRLRHKEHRHLLQLSTSRLETLTQRCMAQERAIADLNAQLVELRNENNVLGKENEDLQVEVQELKSESAGKDVAMEAMTSAVGGLEGWIENARPFATTSNEPSQPPKTRRREVVRGRGRFRGRYWIDVPEDEIDLYETEVDPRDLQDGVKAWVRGFRDVEEGLKARDRPQLRYRKERILDDDFGEYEVAA